MLPLPQVDSAFGFYVNSIANMITGMLLFACWTNRDVFEPTPESTPAVTSERAPPAGPSAT
jgi:hypothetical protein